MRARVHAPRRSREHRIGDILLAARTVFCKKGYETATVAEIAENIGVVEGTIYKYFSSKRELLLQVLEHWYAEMFGDYARDLAQPMPVRMRLYTLVFRHLCSIRDYPLLCRLMFSEVRSERDYHGSQLHQQNRLYTQLMMDVLQSGVDEGVFRNDLPISLLRHIVYGGIEHHSWNFMWGRGAFNPEQMAEQITALLCDGIAKNVHKPKAAKIKI